MKPGEESSDFSETSDPRTKVWGDVFFRAESMGCGMDHVNKQYLS